MDQEWRLVSPVSLQIVPQRPAAGIRSSASRAIGLLSNRKPGTEELQSLLRAMLETNGYDVRMYEKVSAGEPARDELLERISDECMLVVTGTGD
jgi:hypothetical protein